MTIASLVIPSRGGAARLPRLLDHLAAQEFSDWEAIVVLDGDIDGSEHVVAARQSQLPVRAVVFAKNRGRSQALNAGFAQARGEVLIRCDDDLEPRPDYIQRHVDSHARADQGTVGIYRNVLHDTAYTRVYGRAADERFRADAYATPSDRRWLFWAGNCSITRDTWSLIGPYDTRYREYGWEDVDYGYRLAQAGIPVVLDHSLETVHRAAAVTTQIRAERAFASGRARHLFETIHGPGSSGWATPPATAWNRATNVTSARLNRERTATAAGRIDAVLPRLPAAVGRKLVALLVESASIAGFRDAAEAPTAGHVDTPDHGDIPDAAETP